MATLDDFEIWSKHLYKLTTGKDFSDYMSDTACLSAEKINVKGSEWLNDKSKLREKLPLEWLIPEYGYIEDGVIHDYPEQVLSTRTALEETSTVVKHVGSSSGENIYFIDVEQTTLTERMTTIKEILKASHQGRYVVYDWAMQHEYAEEIFSMGSNSLRFLVFSPEGEYPQIAACVQKWATLTSGAADNWNKGGLTTAVINGVMLDTMEDFTRVPDRGGNGSSRLPTYPNVDRRHEIHIETGERIMGKTIPFWTEAEEMVLEASNILREELPFIGWDVIITPSGPRIIEGNPWPGIQLIQVHYPLLANVRFRQFLESHNVEGL